MLIDTSGWFCIFDETDARHEKALAVYRSSTLRITHRYVVAELFGLAITRRQDLARFAVFVKDVLRDSNVQTIWIDDSLTWEAIDLLDSRSDKLWSLCDAVSFVVMEQLGLTGALTTDRHFEQVGFVKLLDS